MTMTNAEILSICLEIEATARNYYPQFSDAPAIQYNLDFTHPRTLGRAYVHTGRGEYRVSLNVPALNALGAAEMVDTIAHEIAHVVCMAMGWDMGHGKTWKAVCKALGGDGMACKKITVEQFAAAGMTPPKRRDIIRYLYVVNGQRVNVKSHMHNRLQRCHDMYVSGNVAGVHVTINHTHFVEQQRFPRN